jgi:Fis family transcriptional regulator
VSAVALRSKAGMPVSMPMRERRKDPLRQSVQLCLDLYFKDLEGHEANGIYHMVISEVEHAMLERVMQFAGGNQSRAAEILGINRSTLRKRLEQYGMMP